MLIKSTFAALTVIAVLANSSLAFADKGLPVKITKNTEHKSVVAAAQPTPPAAPAQPKVVTVQAGDYLEKVATTNETTSLRLFYANSDIANPDLIFPDQKLRIPTAEESLTPREVPVNQQIAVPTPAEGNAAATAPAPRPAVASNYAPSDGSVWDRLAACEAGGNWAINTGNGFYGGLQFTLSSWQAAGGSGMPNAASREEQIARGKILQSRSGWGAWPACSAKLGL